MPMGRRQRQRLKLGALATTVVFVSAIDMGFCQVVKMAITLSYSCWDSGYLQFGLWVGGNDICWATSLL